MSRRPRAIVILALLLVSLTCCDTWADPATTTAPSTEATTAPTTAPTTVPTTSPRRAIAALSQVADRIQQTTSLLKQADLHVVADRVTSNIEQDLADLTTEISTRLQEGPNLAAAP